MSFTAEEAWQTRRAESGAKDMEESVHLRLFPDVPAQWRDDALAERWEKIRAARRVVTGAIEVERAAKRIGSALQADPEISVGSTFKMALAGIDFAEVANTSSSTVNVIAVGTEVPGAFTLQDVPEVFVVPRQAQGSKCERCWRVLPEVGKLPAKPGLCRRCTEAVPR